MKFWFLKTEKISGSKVIFSFQAEADAATYGGEVTTLRGQHISTSRPSVYLLKNVISHSKGG
jgi:hypothetical protein